MQNINYKSEIFKQELYDLINNSNLPICIVYYIINLLQKQIELHYYTALNLESIERDVDINNSSLIQKKEKNIQEEQQQKQQ